MSSAKALSVILVVLVSNSCVLGSAIPMWEFLSRGEKMSHLFNMFGKQVQEYCNAQSMPDCNKVLLVYGMKNLAKMNDEHLDNMDPYQRGATDIIWDSMMKGTFKTGEEMTNKNDKNEKDQEDFYSTGSEAQEPNVPHTGNSLGSQEEASSIEEYLSPAPSRFLVGPMVIRVMPDGRPVPGDSQRPLPKDEDAEEFKLMRSQPIPSLEELTRRMSSQSSYFPSSQMRPPAPERYQMRARPAYSLPAQFRIHSV